DVAQTSFQTVRLKLVYIRAERVRFNNVRACAYVFAVNFTDKVGRNQVQFIIRTIDVDALRVEHRAHCAIEDVGAIGVKNFAKVWHGLGPSSVVGGQLQRARTTAD